MMDVEIQTEASQGCHCAQHDWSLAGPSAKPMLVPAYLLNDTGLSLSRDSEEHLTRWGPAGQEGGGPVRALSGGRALLGYAPPARLWRTHVPVADSRKDPGLASPHLLGRRLDVWPSGCYLHLPWGLATTGATARHPLTTWPCGLH